MDVFISYSSKEYEEARLVNDVLLKNGISTWMAPESIQGGSSYTREIPKAISLCRLFLLILSDNAQKSRWVSSEVENAFKKEKIILPFVIEDFVLNDEFDFLLSQSQRIEAYEKKAKSLEELVGRIKSLLKSEEVPIEISRKIDRSLSDDEPQKYNKEEILGLKNKEFAFKCLEILHEQKRKDDIEKLTDEEFCRNSFKMIYPILKEIRPDVNDEWIFMDIRGRRRYYPDVIDLFGKRYIVCNDWFYNNKTNPRDTRTPFIKWVLR